MRSKPSRRLGKRTSSNGGWKPGSGRAQTGRTDTDRRHSMVECQQSSTAKQVFRTLRKFRSSRGDGWPLLYCIFDAEPLPKICSLGQNRSPVPSQQQFPIRTNSIPWLFVSVLAPAAADGRPAPQSARPGSFRVRHSPNRSLLIRWRAVRAIDHHRWVAFETQSHGLAPDIEH